MQTLNEIGLKHGTDKASNSNDFLVRYEPHIAPLRDKPVKLLEIGVLNGGSVRTWKDYFPNGQIIGADINPEVRQYADDRISIEIMDQGNNGDLDRLAAMGPYDVIIDDGSHHWYHQITTFRKLMPSLKAGGVYIIEDLDTSHGKYMKSYGAPWLISTTDYLKQLAAWVVGLWAIPDESKRTFPDEFLTDMAEVVEYVSFTRGAAIIRRRY